MIKTVDRKFYRELGQAIHDKRKDKRMSLRELAKMVGCAAQMLDNYEMGLAKIKDSTLDKICDALEISNLLTVEVKLGL